MFAGVTPYLQPMLEPEYVADSIITSVRKNEVNCVLPDSIRILLPLKWYIIICYQFGITLFLFHECFFFFSLLPAKVCWELMHRVIKGPQVMMEFKGRPKVAAG